MSEIVAGGTHWFDFAYYCMLIKMILWKNTQDIPTLKLKKSTIIFYIADSNHFV